MQIRPARAEDAETISRLITQSAHTFLVQDFSAEGRQRFMTDFSAARMHERLSAVDTEYRYRLAEIDGELAGVCGIRGASHLYSLYTAAGFQRRGVARALWQAALADMSARGISEVTVNASNYAVPAYMKLGFVRVSPMQEVDGVVFNPMIYRVVI